MDPINLSLDCPPQTKPEGIFRTIVRSGSRYLEVQDRGDASLYRALYCWSDLSPCASPDLVQANWFSCTYPAARFTSQFFAARIIGTARHHILNDEYVVRDMGGEVKERRKIETLEELIELVDSVFGLAIPEVRWGLSGGLSSTITNNLPLVASLLAPSTRRSS